MRRIFLPTLLLFGVCCLSQTTSNQALCIVNNEVIVSPLFVKSKDDITKVTVLKSEKGTEKYGEIGKFGVLEIETGSKHKGYSLNAFKKWFGLSEKAKVMVNGCEMSDSQLTIEPTSIGEIKVEPVFVENSETFTKVIKITIDSTPPTSGKKGGIIIR